MSLDQEIHRWLKSVEFDLFHQKVEQVLNLILEKKEEGEYFKDHFIEIGRRYNHFIFMVTEDFLIKAKKGNFLENELLDQALVRFILDLEKVIEKEHPITFSFFLKYRESLKQ